MRSVGFLDATPCVVDEEAAALRLAAEADAFVGGDGVTEIVGVYRSCVPGRVFIVRLLITRDSSP